MADAPWSPAAFEQRYAADPDPWSFATSDYELGRYEAILRAVRPPPHRYRLAYEPACSVGVLTARLLERCEVVVATDVAPTAVREAQVRCRGRAGAQIDVGALQDGPGTAQAPDLLVLSEVGYYFSRSELRAIAEDLAVGAAPGADLVACHWTGTSADHQLSGSEVHEVLEAAFGGRADVLRHEVHDGFLLDAWRLR